MVELFIAVRHLKERKFQSIFSILGVAISVTVLMVSLTVSNGLEKNMLKSLLTLNPHIVLTKGNGDVSEDYMDVKKKIEEINVSNESFTEALLGLENGNIFFNKDFGIIALSLGNPENNINYRSSEESYHNGIK